MLLDQAIVLNNTDQTQEAVSLYKKIIKLSPEWATPYYNLGLIFKYQLDWEQSLYYNNKASNLDSSDEASWWNLGIAATALGQWHTARTAWSKCGVKIDVNSDEPDMDLGNTPIRLNPDESGEVVWGKRTDPARAIILSIPFPESGHRYGDLLLNDGAPQGYRLVNDIEYPVFNELQLITKSKYKTYSCKVHTSDSSFIEKLEQLCKDSDVEMEDWSTVKYLCKQCSEGVVHEEHDHDLQEKSENEAVIGFASFDSKRIIQALEKWRVITLCDHDDLIIELE